MGRLDIRIRKSADSMSGLNKSRRISLSLVAILLIIYVCAILLLLALSRYAPKGISDGGFYSYGIGALCVFGAVMLMLEWNIRNRREHAIKEYWRCPYCREELPVYKEQIHRFRHRSKKIDIYLHKKHNHIDNKIFTID